MSLPLRKCGLKYYDVLEELELTGHFPCGSVDWNIQQLLDSYHPKCHFPCGSVDWNLLTKKEEPKLLLVTSLAEVWIEIFLSHHHCHRLFRHFPCGSVDWNTVSVSPYIRLFGHFPCGSVDWNFSTGLDGADGVSHFPCGSVDWNLQIIKYDFLNFCHFPCGSVELNNMKQRKTIHHMHSLN